MSGKEFKAREAQLLKLKAKLLELKARGLELPDPKEDKNNIIEYAQMVFTQLQQLHYADINAQNPELINCIIATLELLVKIDNNDELSKLLPNYLQLAHKLMEEGKKEETATGKSLIKYLSLAMIVLGVALIGVSLGFGVALALGLFTKTWIVPAMASRGMIDIGAVIFNGLFAGAHSSTPLYPYLISAFSFLAGITAAFGGIFINNEMKQNAKAKSQLGSNMIRLHGMFAKKDEPVPDAHPIIKEDESAKPSERI
ncbi:hypothetical protein [Legionella impletisoli]|uniref:Uncharacterized protein n=1 Tax=Legionella impletisoli TaxID=343510 RepID=A0A917JTE3_9GAMM|nr:hypothetical protein [Legionella impletisoli]GGI80784.1 hypothetical protein GCM10007966_06640 [Legionella impletisoli]